MPSENTKKILDDLKKAGINVSSIEQQLQVNPLADRQADAILGGGILRQSDYTRYMNDLQIKENQLSAQVNQLASLHDAQNAGVQLTEEQKAAVKAMEDALIGTGEFDEASIRSLSHRVLNPTNPVVKPPVQPQQPSQFQPTNFQPQQTQIDTSKFVDASTMQAALANVAYGGIATNMEINAALDEVRGLGISVDRAKIRTFQEKLRVGYEAGKQLDDILEETFEVSKARQAKQQAEIDNQIKLKVDEQVAERLKEAGVPITNKLNMRRNHPILDRKRNAPANVQTPNPNNQTGEGDLQNPLPVDPNAGNKLPVNRFGDVEIFRGRRTKEDRMQSAAGVLDEVLQHYANDPTYVE